MSPVCIISPRDEKSVTVSTLWCNFYIWSSTFSWHLLHFLYLRSVATPFVAILIFAHLLCIQFPSVLHNIVFANVFLPQMPHRSSLIDGFTLICQILLAIIFVFNWFTFMPLLSSALFQLWNFSCCFAMVFAINTRTLEDNISCNILSLISCIKTSITMVGNSVDKALMYSNVFFKLFR